MMCALLLKSEAARRPPAALAIFKNRTATDAASPGRCASRLHHGAAAAVHDRLTYKLFDVIPKGFFPEQDTGRFIGSIQADQSISFQSMSVKLATNSSTIVRADPAVDVVTGNTGTGSGGGRAPPTAARSPSSSSLSRSARRPPSEIVARLRRKLSQDRRRALVSYSRFRICASAAGRATRLTNTRCRRTTRRSSTNGRPSSQELQKSSIVLDVNSAISSRTGSKAISPSIATRPRGSGSPPPKSTIRSTMLSDSGKCRRFTASSTSITSSWRSRRAIGRIQARCGTFT